MKNNNSILFALALGSVLLNTLSLMSAVKLQVASSQGVPLSNVVAGSPCLVEVVVTGNAKVLGKPSIAGLAQENIVSERSSTHMFITNGEQKSEQHLGYLVHFNKTGTHTLGPARIETDGGTLVSETVTVTVQNAPKEDKSHAHQAAFARWKIAKEKIFVGETVPYSLRFYYTDPKTTQIGLRGTDPAEHLIFAQDQTRQTTEKIGSITYSVIELPGQVTPTQAGALTLPRALFTYVQPDKEDRPQEQWAAMSMFGAFVEPKQVLASSVQITALPIPENQTHNPVQGVGSIKAVTLTCATTKAKQGDPITCRLTIEGTFEPTLLKAPELAVPQELRVYPSTTEDTGTYPHRKKSFEYVLQSTQAGNIRIPTQKLCFFNPHTQKCEELAQQAAEHLRGCERAFPAGQAPEIATRATFQTFITKPVQLTISPNPQATYEPPQEITTKTSTQEIQAAQATPTQAPTQQDVITIPWEAWWVPPLWLFLLVLALPVIWHFSKAYVTRCTRRYLVYRKQRTLIKKSMILVRNALKDKELQLFWQTLQTVARELLPPAQSWTDHEIIKYLMSNGWQEQDLALWNHLWELGSKVTFFAAHDKELTELETLSTKILERLKKTLVRKPWHHFFS